MFEFGLYTQVSDSGPWALLFLKFLDEPSSLSVIFIKENNFMASVLLPLTNKFLPKMVGGKGGGYLIRVNTVYSAKNFLKKEKLDGKMCHRNK